MMSPEVRARQELINSAAAQRNHDLALRAQRRSIAVITQILDRAQEEESEHAFSNEPKPTLARTRRREVIGKLTRVLLQLKTDAARTLQHPTPTPCPSRLSAKPRIPRRSDRSDPAPGASGAVRSSGPNRLKATARGTSSIPHPSMRKRTLHRPQGPVIHRYFPVRITNSGPATHVPSAPQHVLSPAQLLFLLSIHQSWAHCHHAGNRHNA